MARVLPRIDVLHDLQVALLYFVQEEVYRHVLVLDVLDGEICERYL